MRRLAAVLVAWTVACSSSPEWVSSSNGSLCSWDAVVRQEVAARVDLVIVVDDSPSARPSRSILRARTLDALRRLVTERDPGDPASLAAAHDLHVLIRGVSTSYERRTAYLAKVRDNLWIEPQGELRDAEAFLTSCATALDEMPEGTEDTPFVSRVADLRRGEGGLRAHASVVVLFATAHDDSGPIDEGWPRALSELDGHWAGTTALSVLVDARALGPSIAQGPQVCGSFSGFSGTGPLDPSSTPVPRLAAVLKKSFDTQLTLLCSDAQELGDLLFQRNVWFTSMNCAPFGLEGCTLLMIPPVTGDDARCERPELGLVPATASERRYAESQLDASLVHERPVCHMAEVARGGGPGEGWFWPADSCRPQFSAGAQPAGGSYLLLRCVAPKCP